MGLIFRLAFEDFFLRQWKLQDFRHKAVNFKTGFQNHGFCNFYNMIRNSKRLEARTCANLKGSGYRIKMSSVLCQAQKEGMRLICYMHILHPSPEYTQLNNNVHIITL